MLSMHASNYTLFVLNSETTNAFIMENNVMNVRGVKDAMKNVSITDICISALSNINKLLKSINKIIFM